MRTHLVQEVAIVANNNHGALITIEHILQPTNGIDIKVVRWFIEQQDIWIRKQSLRKQHPQLPAWRDFAHG